MKKDLAVLTMVKGDHHWARIWAKHYAPQVRALSDLFVFLDGDDPELQKIFEGCNVEVTNDVAHDSTFEKTRMKLKHDKIRSLLNDYTTVLLVDIDEYVCVDPDLNQTLYEYYPAAHKGEVVHASLGFDVIQWDEKDVLDLTKPILSQRHYFFINPNYCKPNAFFKTFENANHHRVRNEPWVIDRNVWLFHMRYADNSLRRRYIQERKTMYLDQKGDEEKGGSLSWELPGHQYRKIVRHLQNGPDAVEASPEFCDAHIELMVDFYNLKNRVGDRNKSQLLKIPERFQKVL